MKQPDFELFSGLNLHNHNLIAAETTWKERFFFYLFILLLGLSGAFACFYTAFPLPVYWQVVIPCAFIFSTAFTALFLAPPRPFLRIILTALGLSALLLLIISPLSDNLIQGFIRTFNIVILMYERNSGYDFFTLSAQPAAVGAIAAANTTFAVTALFFLALLLAWLLIRKRNAFACILLTLPFLAVSLLFIIIPHYAALTALLLFWAFLLLYGNRQAHPASFALLPVLTVCLLLIALLFPMNSYQRPELAEDLRNGLTEMPSISALYRTGGVAGNTNRVNLQYAGNVSYTGKSVLRLQTSNPNTDYLKGFVGGIYTGISWESLPEEDYQELNEILDGLKIQNLPRLFSERLQSYNYLDRSAYEYEYALTIQNIGVNARCIYAPYGLISGPAELPGIDFVHDLFLRSGNELFGAKEYSMRASGLPDVNRYTTLYYRIVGQFSRDPRRRALLTQLGLDRSFDSYRQMDEWTMPAQLMAALGPEQAAFAGVAQEYTRFVYEHYTQLPEELQDILAEYREAYDLDTEHYPWPSMLAEAIIRQIQSDNSYTLSPGLTPAGRDFVEYFLLENHRGYCVHFATAAAALLRSSGIPARYAEGFVISSRDNVSSDGWIYIPDSRAHAWVEVYYSGVGWVPLEATPGVYDGIIDHDALETAAAIQSFMESLEEKAAAEAADSPELAEETEDEQESEAAAAEAEIPDETGQVKASPEEEQNPLTSIPGRILTSFTALGLLVAAAFINRKLRIETRGKKFGQADRSQAALAIYDYLIKLPPHLQRAADFSGRLPGDLYAVVLQARFSRHALTEQELSELLRYAEDLVQEAQKKTALWRCLIDKYIDALY